MKTTAASDFKRILLVRLDRIGDLVLTLPIDQALPQYQQVDWWIPSGLSFVTEAARPRRRAREISRRLSARLFIELFRELIRSKYNTAIVFHAPWWIGFLLWLARVPLRGGVKSQWHSLIFFNRSVRQKRSQAVHNELEYNYLLVEGLLELPSQSLPRHTLRLQYQTPDSVSTNDLALLGRLQLKPFQYIIVHPGMGGSALNWTLKNYIEFISHLITERSAQKVVITGTPSDKKYTEPLRKPLASQPNIVWLTEGSLTGTELIKILSLARSVVAPSTGVLHLAASTGRPTLGIYSPVRVQRALRWGPQGKKVQSLTPDVNCPGERQCLGETCVYFNCMETITTSQAIKALNELNREEAHSHDSSEI